MKNQIIWQDLKLKSRLDGVIENDIEEELPEDFEEEVESENLVTTPFGLLRVNDFFNPMKQYNWYMAHVNFNLSEQIVKKISKIPGVEKFLPISRYRFMIAIGLVFETMLVKESIENALECTPVLSQEVVDKQRDLEQIYDKWAIYFKNSTNWEYCTEDNYDTKILEFENLQKKNGGILITHDNMFQ